MGDQQERALVAFQGFLQLFDRGQIQVVGWLVQDQQVDTAGLQQGQGGAGAFARRERIHGAGRVVGLESEFGQQGADLCRCLVGQYSFDSVAQLQVAGQQPAGLVDLANGHRGPSGDVPGIRFLKAEQQAEQC